MSKILILKDGIRDWSILENFVEKNGSSAATDAKEDNWIQLNKNLNVDPKNDWGEDTGLTDVDKQNCEVKHERVKDVAEDETSALAALVFRIYHLPLRRRKNLRNFQ